MSYTPTTWDVGDVITPQRMNKIETGLEEVYNSGGYDIIISTSNLSDVVSDYTIKTCDWNKVKAKVLAGDPISGFLYDHFNYDEAVDGDTNSDIFPLVSLEINSDGAYATFESIRLRGSSSSTQLSLKIFKVFIYFDLQTGEISSAAVNMSKDVNLS